MAFEAELIPLVSIGILLVLCGEYLVGYSLLRKHSKQALNLLLGHTLSTLAAFSLLLFPVFSHGKTDSFTNSVCISFGCFAWFISVCFFLKLVETILKKPR